MTLTLAVAVTAAVLIVAAFSILQRTDRDKNAWRNDRLSGFGVLEQSKHAGDGGMLTSLGFRESRLQVRRCGALLNCLRIADPQTGFLRVRRRQ